MAVYTKIKNSSQKNLNLTNFLIGSKIRKLSDSDKFWDNTSTDIKDAQFYPLIKFIPKSTEIQDQGVLLLQFLQNDAVINHIDILIKNTNNEELVNIKGFMDEYIYLDFNLDDIELIFTIYYKNTLDTKIFNYIRYYKNAIIPDTDFLDLKNNNNFNLRNDSKKFDFNDEIFNYVARKFYENRIIYNFQENIDLNDPNNVKKFYFFLDPEDQEKNRAKVDQFRFNDFQPNINENGFQANFFSKKPCIDVVIDKMNNVLPRKYKTNVEMVYMVYNSLIDEYYTELANIENYQFFFNILYYINQKLNQNNLINIDKYRFIINNPFITEEYQKYDDFIIEII